MDDPKPSFAGQLAGWLQKAEIALIAGAVVAVALKYAGYTADQLLTISLWGLAVIYFLGAFSQPKPGETGGEQKQGFTDLLFSTILPKLAGIGSAVAIIGVLFGLQHLPGYEEMLRIGLFASGSAAALIAIGIAMGNERAKSLMPVLYRLVPLVIISAYFLFNRFPV